MKNILIIGAGRTATAMIDYLINESEIFDWNITVADYSLELAQQKVKESTDAKAVQFDINDEQKREELISHADVVVSYLPNNLHPIVAKECLKQNSHLVTASYISDEMKSFDKKAKEKGLIFLNEMGLDPGIDHMDAMYLIEKVRAEGGEVLSIKSCCGGLVAPENDDNCWGYKFTWSPMNVVLAGQSGGRFLQNSEVRDIPYDKIFKETELIEIPGYGTLESYANRDSIPYITTYGLHEVADFYRGTLRQPGYSEAWNLLIKLGLTNNINRIPNSSEMTYKDWINSILKDNSGKSNQQKLADFLNLSLDDKSLQKVLWLDLFSDEKIKKENATSAEILLSLLEYKWFFKENEKDIIILHSEVVYVLNSKKKKITSSMTVIGNDKRNTAMTYTAGMPAGIGTKLIMQNRIKECGVIRPIYKDIYEPALEELSQKGFQFEEEITDLD